MSETRTAPPAGSAAAARVLAGPPSVPGLAARSLFNQSRRRRRPGDRAGSGNGDPGGLPDTALTLSDQPVDAGRLARYQRLCGFDVSGAVPATFVHVLAFPLGVALMADPAFPFPLLGLVHVANRITQLRPVDVSARLDLTVRAENRRPHPSGEQVDLVADAAVAGELVWTGLSTYLHRGAPSGTRSSGGRPPSTDEPRADPTMVWRLPADLGRRYAAVSGDRNPIHLSALSARAFGFPRAIAHGMWLQARVLATLAPRLPSAFTAEVDFKTPALLPSTVAFQAVASDGGWDVAVRAAGSGRPHVVGRISPG
ncbi:MAG: MaoC/PaaZ C-terminal domain-containing protein [bacterium]